MIDPVPFERIEREAWCSLVEACPDETRRELGLTYESVSGALVLSAPCLQNPLFNRVIGLGTAGTLARTDVEAVIDGYENTGVEHYFVHLWPGQARAVIDWLERRGVRRYRRGWVKLFCDGQPRLDAARCSYPVRRARITESAEVGRLLARGFDLPERAAPVFGALTGRPEWHVFVSTDGDAPIGAGLLYLGYDGAYLAGAATDPAYRGRGVQSALLSARLRAGVALGYRRFISETGESVPGDPQHSQRNLERAGLRPAGVRDNYAPSGMEWAHGRLTG